MTAGIFQLFICFITLTSPNYCDFIRAESGLKLNEFILHFEPLHYNHENLVRGHRRMKRSTNSALFSSGHFHLNFTAHQRLFLLHLRTDPSVFANDIQIESTDGDHDYDLSKFLVGNIEDEENSSVHGVITEDGLFDGTISTRYEEFYVEPAKRYFEEPKNFHSVIYKASDVHLINNSGICHSHLLYERIKNLENAHVEESLENNHRTKSHHKVNKFNVFHHISMSSSPLSGKHAILSNVSDMNKRTKRSSSAKVDPMRLKWVEEHAKKRTAIDPKKTTCMLYLQADHLFYKKMGSVDACIEQMTRHVQKVNKIYKVVDFDQDGFPDNIYFMIKRIKVHTVEAVNDPKYRFPSNYGVEKFLELFSEEDYDSFCLAYMFTYRDFEGGTLGLAWTGDLKNAGGVCEKNGHYRGSLKSLNTGIVTLLNYGKHVPPAVSHVTLAHEIGHNFGSPVRIQQTQFHACKSCMLTFSSCFFLNLYYHDPEDDGGCTPGGLDGNYIMFARATSGDKYNNQKFSPCSMRSISSVLSTKARGNKGCFTEPQDSICGNEVVEKGEECDCGWEEDCKEPCCFPMRSNPPRNEPPCKLRPNMICSPSQGPCCTGNCKLAVGSKCRNDNGCRSSSLCDGSGPKCPPSIHKPNRTICNDEFVCYMGECTGSICIAYGLEFCQCKRKPYDSIIKSCELCCKIPGQDHTCKSSFEWNSPPYMIPDMYAKPGTPCNDYNGYCDVFQKCREVDPSGPLETLRKLLLSNESMKSLKEWVMQQWWGVLLLAIGFVIFLILVVKVFGKKPERLKDSDVQYNRPIAPIRSSSTSNQLMLSAGYHVRPYNQRRSNSNRVLTTALAKQSRGHMEVITALSSGEPSNRAILHSDRPKKWV